MSASGPSLPAQRRTPRPRRVTLLALVSSAVLVASPVLATRAGTLGGSAPSRLPVPTAGSSQSARGSARASLLAALRASSHPPQPATHPSPPPSPVGVLSVAGSPYHFCSASVVDSPQGDVVLTAAHCVVGTGRDLVFVPGYDRGREPYGSWQVTAAYAAPAWLRHRDPADDFAFLRVAARDVDGRPTEVQQLTGGYRLGGPPPAAARVTVVAYAAGAGHAPLRCAPWVHWAHGYPVFDCAGYPGGTSGGPWLSVAAGRTDTIRGIIAGFHQGGCREDTSYSPTFGSTVEAVYELAARAGPPESLPPAGPSGC